jgi:hypothetical protein
MLNLLGVNAFDLGICEFEFREFGHVDAFTATVLLGQLVHLLFQLALDFWICINQFATAKRKFYELKLSEILHEKFTYALFPLYSRILSRKSCWIGSETFWRAGAAIPKLRRATWRTPESNCEVNIFPKMRLEWFRNLLDVHSGHEN